MSLLSFLGGLFGKHPGSGRGALRNKAGGLARINAKADEGGGTGALVNRIVRTVRLESVDAWQIDPPQEFRVTGHLFFARAGITASRGDLVRIVALADSSLTPIPGGLATDEEVRELFAPRLRQGEKAHV